MIPNLKFVDFHVETIKFFLSNTINVSANKTIIKLKADVVNVIMISHTTMLFNSVFHVMKIKFIQSKIIDVNVN